MKNYEQIMKQNPVYFDKINDFSKLQHVFEAQINTMLEIRDEDGRRVYVYRPGKWNPDVVKFSEIFSAAFILAEMVSEEPKTQVAGVTCIADAADFGFKQVRNFTLQDARTMTSFLQVPILLILNIRYPLRVSQIIFVYV